MHLLATTSTSFDDIVEPVDLGQTPGDVVVLSFADSDLAALASAWSAERDLLPSVRLANLRDLRHPMSVDLWIERAGVHAKVILVRLIGGLYVCGDHRGLPNVEGALATASRAADAVLADLRRRSERSH